MRRRTVLIGGGSIGAATIGGAAFVTSVSAEETVEAGYFAVDDYQIDTQSGRLAYLYVQNISLVAEWENFDHQATTVDFELEARVGEDSFTKIGQTSVDVTDDDVGSTDYEGTVTTSVAKVDLVEVFGSDAFETPADHAGSEYESDVTNDFDVEFRLTATVHDAGGHAVTGTVTDDALVSVRNLGADVTPGGAGTFNGSETDDGTSGAGFDPEAVTVSRSERWIQNGNATAATVTLKWEAEGESGQSGIEVCEHPVPAGDATSVSPCKTRGDLDEDDYDIVAVIEIREA